MPDFREVMAAEREADDTMDVALTSAANETDPAIGTVAIVHALNALRLEIRAQGMRFDYSMTQAAKQ